ncbi:phosphoribosylformylglycinamidine synthase subunit PurL [Candidatus Kaiserbacteria bacterium]|nr:phosphoribosylformylglycinamidine synthase subunit PurL [Candidatus Kaiserbacteria bacterium]
MSIASDIQRALAEAMASEHTSYKSTKQFLKELPTRGRQVIQGPGENAGIVDLGRGWALAMRIESHNHPSFIKPYSGAATGVGGILRDIFTMGARPIAIIDSLRFGTDAKAKRLLPKVVHGISDYGNCVGVPVVGGDLYFDPTFNHNCLVNVAAFGLVRRKNIIYGRATTPGSDLIYVGARTGRDGVGGAQMASTNLEALDASTVQEADPFLEKLLLEACLELAGSGWIEGMQDMGAAGLLCSTSEVVLRGRARTKRNLGAHVLLDQVPTKAARLSPVEMLLSESQERMLIVGRREHRAQILSVFKRWDLEARVIGRVTNDGHYTIRYRDARRRLTTLPMQFAELFPDLEEDWELLPWRAEGGLPRKASREITRDIWRQYDWSVGVRTIKGPDRPGHYAIIDIPEIDKEVVIAWSSDEGRSDRSPTEGVTHAFDRCLRQLRSKNAQPLGITNCLNFGHPRDSMGAFAETTQALAKLCKKARIPIVGGNVSLYNAHGKHSIKPTPVLVMAGVRPAR